MATAKLDCFPRTPRSAARGLAIGLIAPGFLLALAACETVGEPPAADASMGLLIARDKCGSCHQLGGAGESPNPRATPFGEIVSRPGMTPDALAGWLRDGHNYPVEMGFHLEPRQVDSLVAYMMRWRAEGAPPAP